MLEQGDVWTMRVSRTELAVIVASVFRLSTVAVLTGLTSSGNADVGFLISPDGVYMVVYVMVVYMILFMVSVAFGAYLITHANKSDVAAARRSSRMLKQHRASARRANSVAAAAHQPLGSGLLAAMV